MSRKNAQTSRELYFSSPNHGAEKKVNLSTTIVACAATLALGLAIGLNFDYLSNLGNQILGRATIETVDFNELDDIYRTLSATYDGEVDSKKIIEEAKRGLVNAVEDEYSYYMTAAEYEEFDKNLNGDVGAGVGIELGLRDGFVKVLRTTVDNPARRAGILAGDIIYKVDDEDVSAMNADEIAQRVRGAEGTEVKLTVVRDNEELEFTLVRETINNESVYLDFKNDDKVAVLTVTRFDKDSGELAEKYAKEALDKGVEKIIVDLRGNGGGYVESAVEIASLWLDGKSVSSTKSSSKSQYNKEYKAKTGKNILARLKTVVLINGNSASASEILAGALHDHGVATLVGEKSYGKGSMQSLEPLSDGGVLRVTIARWYTPNGKNISKDGIEPDEVVERSYEQINKEIDPQLDRALEL